LEVNIMKIILVVMMALGALSARAEPLPEASPEALGFTTRMAAQLDALVNKAASTHPGVPGGVLIVARHGKIAYRRAFGKRALLDVPVPNSADTIYDLASMTKVLATAPSAMKLLESGGLKLTDRLTDLLPETAGTGKDAVTVEQLLRHRAGLPADTPESEYNGTLEQIWANLYKVRLEAPAGKRFEYSDVGMQLLGRIVERVSGKALDRFAAETVFEPLGLEDTGYRPNGQSGECPRCAPTQKRDGKWMIGDVHDPRAWKMGGVAGHAGVFSTADDVAVYAQAILDCGEHDGTRILQRETVRRMTESPAMLPAGQKRGLGWDIDTPYSTPRGTGFPVGSFGHTGYTGTSVWIDPSSRTLVVLLTNRVHPDDSGTVVELRKQVSSVVAASIATAPRPSVAGLAGFCASKASAR
jgi:CubicO group peptidase (beta-lactamase class C family)